MTDTLLSASHRDLARAFAAASRVSRATLYGMDDDAQMPMHLPRHARIPYLGFAGANYKPGGVCLIGINPGGGGDAYQRATPGDDELLFALEALRGSHDADADASHRTMCDKFEAQFKLIPFKTIVNPVLQATGATLADAAYLNMFAYRTRGDKSPSSKALARSCKLVVEPLLAALQPGYVVLLGYKARDAAAKHLTMPSTPYVIKRTIGDRVICAEALAVIAQIAADSARRGGGGR
jgi:hypothetical protein